MPSPLILHPGTQTCVEAEVLDSWDKGHDRVVLAACPGFGKTETAISIVGKTLARESGSRALVLTHGQTTLRNQFIRRLQKYELPFTWAPYVANNPVPWREVDAQVVVTLPQTIARIRNLGRFDLIVVDEAHEWYSAPIVQRLLRDIKPRLQLLLSGTPSPLVSESVPVVATTMSEVYGEGRLANAMIEIASSAYTLERDDYDNKDEVRASYRWRAEQTNATLDDLLSALVNRLTYRWGETLPLSHVVVQKASPLAWKLTLGFLGKTMVACRSIEQAEQVRAYFERKRVRAVISHSDPSRPQGYDPDSTILDDFLSDDSKILIVVRRGVLGFDFADLANVVDMTGSENPNRIYQLLARVVRKGSPRKIFIKMAPTGPGMKDYTFIIMSLVMRLALDKEFLSTWDGSLRAAASQPVLVRRHSERKTNDTESPKNGKRPRPTPVDEGLLMFGPQGWHDVLTSDALPLSVYKRTTLSAAVEECTGRKIYPPLTIEYINRKILEYATSRGWEPPGSPDGATT